MPGPGRRILQTLGGAVGGSLMRGEGRFDSIFPNSYTCLCHPVLSLPKVKSFKKLLLIFYLKMFLSMYYTRAHFCPHLF